VSCFSSCFRPNRREDPSTLVSLENGKHMFPKEFLKKAGGGVAQSSQSRDSKKGKKKSSGGGENRKSEID
jgi:hypothetical protein